MNGIRHINELSKCLNEIISLYDEVIAYDYKLIEMLGDSSYDMDRLDEYLEQKDSLSDRLEVLADMLNEQFFNQKTPSIDDSNINYLCNQLADREKKVAELELKTRKAIETYIGSMRTGISTSRKNASKAQKYMINMNNISLVADTYIDTSKKI